MTKHRRPKKPKASPAMPGDWQRMQFVFMKQFYLAGQDAARAVLEKAPDCHQTCTTNALLSFYLGALIPVVQSEAELQRLAIQVLPRIVESIAIVSGMTLQPYATCCPPSNEALN
ncbi:MAG: hypothetical protein WC565_07725 [Parcubacteria group bacterium]|jgi:hypothetical protein